MSCCPSCFEDGLDNVSSPDLEDDQVTGQRGTAERERCSIGSLLYEQESRAVAREPRDAAAVVFGLKFADTIHYKFKSSQASKARLQSSKRTGPKQNLMQNGHSRSSILESMERR